MHVGRVLGFRAKTCKRNLNIQTLGASKRLKVHPEAVFLHRLSTNYDSIIMQGMDLMHVGSENIGSHCTLWQTGAIEFLIVRN